MKKIFFGLIVSFLLLISQNFVFAQASPAGNPNSISGPSIIKTEKEFYQSSHSFINELYKEFFTEPKNNIFSTNQGTDTNIEKNIEKIYNTYSTQDTQGDNINAIKNLFEDIYTIHLETIEKNIKKYISRNPDEESYAKTFLIPFLEELRGRLFEIMNFIQLDDDEDGVLNNDDKCPSTQSGEAVDRNGCSCLQKNCGQFKNFTCEKFYVREVDPFTNQHVEVLRPVCVEIADETPYDLREALRDSQLANHGDSRYIAVYPQHLVGADDKSLQGDASDITVFFQRFANGLTILAGSLAVIFIVINAFTLVVGLASENARSNAKRGLIWSIVALLLIIMSYVIVKTIVSISYSGQEFEIETESQKNKMHYSR